MGEVKQMTPEDIDEFYRRLRAFNDAVVQGIISGDAVIISASGHVDDLAHLQEREEDQ